MMEAVQEFEAVENRAEVRRRTSSHIPHPLRRSPYYPEKTYHTSIDEPLLA